MNKRQWAEEVLADENPDAYFMTDFDDAIVGVTTGIGTRVQGGKPLVVYSQQRLMALLMEDGASEEDAADYYGFNMESAWVGDNTPLIIIEPPEE